MDDLSIAIGERIKRLREAKGVRPYHVALAIKAPNPTVYQWEKGEASPSAYYLIKIADYYGCTVDEILGRANNEHS